MSFITVFLAATTIFVSPEGNDANDGSKAKPVRTPQRAVEMARQVLADETKTIVFTDGTHFFDTHVDVQGDSDITFKAEHRRKAVLSGAVRVTGWKTDPEDARLLVADFPFEPQQERLYTLIVNGEQANFSAYPQFGGQKKMRYLAVEEDYGKNNRTVFNYDPADLPKGGDYRDLDLASAFLFIPQEWVSTTTYVLTNDWRHNTFHLKSRTGMPLGRFNTGYQIMNTRFGLTAPGTWMFEATKKRIVYRPRAGETAANLRACVSRLPSLFDVGKTSYVRFEGLVLEGCYSDFNTNPYRAKPPQALIGGMEPLRLTIDDCDIRYTAGCGIDVVKARYSTIRNSHVHHVGRACVSFFDGGEYNAILYNEIDHSGQQKIGGSGLSVYSRNEIIGNKIHDIGGVGIVMWSQECLVASNEIYRTMTSMRDGGGVYGAQVYCTYKDNYVHDTGDWPGLYNDEGGHHCVYTGNVFENSWWPFHMHDARNIVVTNNTFVNAGGMRYSFQGSAHCVLKDNVIKTALPIDRDPYLDCCDEWCNDVRLRQADGTYAPAQRLTLAKKPLLPCGTATAVRVSAPGQFRGGSIGAARSRAGHNVGGVPYAQFNMVGFDKDYLYLNGHYEFNKLKPYFGCNNYGEVWGAYDAVRLHFAKLTVTVFFREREKSKSATQCGTWVSSDPSLVFTNSNSWIEMGGYKHYYFGGKIPLKNLGLEGDPVGKTIPFNLEVYNADHDEYKYFVQPDGDRMLTGTLLFCEPAPTDPTGLVRIKERFADGTCAFPGPFWPEGGVIQSAPATCDREGEGYRQPLRFDNHDVEMIGYVYAGDATLQGFATLPFSANADPTGAPAERYMKRLIDSSITATCDKFAVRTENWDLRTESTASKNCAYLKFVYRRGGPFRVLVDAQDVAVAALRKDAKVEIVDAASSVTDGVFAGSVTAKVDGKTETLYAKMAFEPKPVGVRELPANGRKGKRYVFDFMLLPEIGNVQVKTAISGQSADEAAARFAADGAAIDFDARQQACKAAWRTFLNAQKTDLKGKELADFHTARHREQLKKNLGR